MKSVKAHGNTKLVKGSRKPKVNKWAKDAQRKTKGTQEPINKKTHGHVKPLGKIIHGRPKKVRQDQVITAEMTK